MVNDDTSDRPARAEPSGPRAAAAALAGGQTHPAPALYVVATPIGNMADLSFRALHVLDIVDAIACEDTRHTAPLLARFGLGRKPLLAAHRHNERSAAEAVLERLGRGDRVALVSDAGTPAVSDPGAAIVAAVRTAGHRVVPIPGASSVLAVLAAAGDVSGAEGGFVFRGFLGTKAAERRDAALRIAADPATQVLLEAPHRIAELATALGAALGERALTIGRELTKQFETVATMPAGDLAAWIAADADRSRGEFALVVHAAPRPAPTDTGLDGDAAHVLDCLLAELPLKQAVSLAASITRLPRNALYAAALARRRRATHRPTPKLRPMISREPTLERIAIAKDLLLAPFGLDESDLMQVLAEIGRHRIDDADLYFESTRSEGWSLEEGIVKSGSFGIDCGVGVRAVSGEKTAFAYSDDISKASLLDAARTVRTIAAAGEQRRVKLSPARVAGTRTLYPALDPILGRDSDAKIAMLQTVERLARAKDPRIVQVMAGLASEHDVMLVARADGTIAADVRPLVRLSVTVIAEQTVKGVVRRETGSSGGGGRFGLAYFDEAQITTYVDDAVRAALVNLDSRPAKAGEMSVVLGPGWPGVLLHEAIGHGLEGDFNRKGSSAFAGRMGQRVAAKGVTVLDDGTLADRRGSLNVDDEGNATQRNVLIEDGILTGYIQDNLNARLMGVKPTGNGRRESYAALPMPRMTNTYMLGGDRDPEEIVRGLKRGLYATNFGGGQVDITSGKFVFSASEAYWVENGKIQYPVKGATLIGNGPDALTRVSAIGNDMRLDAGVGVCGKEGQSVPVGVGQPTLRIDGLTVGGTA
jgi:TldD protein